MGWGRKDNGEPTTVLQALEAWIIGTLLVAACIVFLWEVASRLLT